MSMMGRQFSNLSVAEKSERPKYPCSGFECIQGKRWNLEDTFCYIDDLNAEFPHLSTDVKRSFYALYDGHGGKDCSRELETRILDTLVHDPDFLEGRIETALYNTFMKVEAETLPMFLMESKHSGSTAAVVVKIDDVLYCANVGDTECVLATYKGKKKGKESWDAKLLTEIHNCSSESETQRIKDMGGKIRDKRVLGKVTCTRAFGDYSLKKPKRTKNYLSVEPYIITVPLTGAHEFMFLACDGVWDEFDYHDAANLIGKARRTVGDCPWIASEVLVREALDRGSTDNISAIVVYLTDPSD